MSSRHLSINQSSSGDEGSDHSTSHNDDNDNESSDFLTPTNKRCVTITQTQAIIHEESSDDTNEDDDDDDDDIVNSVQHLQTIQSPKASKMKSLSISRRRTNSTKYTQSVTDHENDGDDTDETDEIYGDPAPIADVEKKEKHENKQHWRQKHGFIAFLCILICCLLTVAIIAFVIFWCENPNWYKTTNTASSPPELNVDEELTANPTEAPIITIIDPDIISTFMPTINPTGYPSIYPTIAPSLEPTIEPTYNPSYSPSIEPTMEPTYVPTYNPTINPSISPTTDPTAIPTSTPTFHPTTGPTTLSTIYPSINPTKHPSINPTHSPSIIPTTDPTKSPTSDPTTNPTNAPTQSPISIILQSGNTIIDQGLTMTFPENAFPNSILEISIGEPDDLLMAIYDESTAPFKARDINDINNNYFLFKVENDPLPTANISYTFSIPIPDDLLTKCPTDYGYEIFTYEEQEGFGQESWPLMILYESVYDDNAETLTAQFYPEMWINKEADILLSCTPGINTPPIRRRMLLQNDNIECHANPISCPIPLVLQTEQCIVLETYSRTHTAVDYQANGPILATATGTIEISETSDVYDEIIVLRHLDGSATIYKSLTTRIVSKDDEVNVGEIIGTATSHLHLEYVPNGELWPRKGYIDANVCILKEPVESGSIEVSDSGQMADDAFSMSVDGYFICKTETGQLNKCSISNLKCGVHELSITIITAPDGYGTWLIQLFNGWKFDDDTTIRNNLNANDDIYESEGHTERWNITVPCTENDRISGFEP